MGFAQIAQDVHKLAENIHTVQIISLRMIKMAKEKWNSRKKVLKQDRSIQWCPRSKRYAALGQIISTPACTEHRSEFENKDRSHK